MAAWCKSLVFALVVTLLVIGWGQSTTAQRLQQIEQQKLLAAHPREVKKLLDELQSDLRSLNQSATKHMEQRSRFSPLVVIRVLHDLKAQLQGELQVKSLEFVDDSALSPQTKEPTSNGHASLQLVTRGTNGCSSLMQRIRATGYFSDVRLSSALEMVDEQRGDLRFTLRCDF